MINLIPPEGHIAARREYYSRVVGTACLLFSVVIVLLCLSRVPTYILIDAQIKAFEMEQQEKGVSTEALKKAEEEVKAIKGILTQLKTTENQFLISSAVDEIEKNKPTNITLVTMQYEVVKDGSSKMHVQGIAQTRTSLSNFKTQLEATDMFSKAEIPISDLAREKDLPFMMTLVIPKAK
jgi:hypothetical protein